MGVALPKSFGGWSWGWVCRGSRLFSFCSQDHVLQVCHWGMGLPSLSGCPWSYGFTNVPQPPTWILKFLQNHLCSWMAVELFMWRDVSQGPPIPPSCWCHSSYALNIAWIMKLGCGSPLAKSTFFSAKYQSSKVVYKNLVNLAFVVVFFPPCLLLTVLATLAA